jgi:putative peptidoglycan lipid II flippase
MSGLAFIAMNRVLAPAFYARGDTRTPTFAGLVSVAINVGLAFALVGPLKAPGIALALAGASAVNTLVLVIALFRVRTPGTLEALALSGRYSLKLILFSLLAGLPIILFKPFLAESVRGWNLTLAAGVSLVATALAFGGIGLVLLVLSRDEMASSLMNALRHRGRGVKV